MSRQAMASAWAAKVADPDAKFVLMAVAWESPGDGPLIMDSGDFSTLGGGAPEDWPLMSWAWSQGGVPSRAKFILVALAQIADATGAAPIVIADLKAMTSLPALEISAGLRRLDARGLIAITGGVAHLRMAGLN